MTFWVAGAVVVGSVGSAVINSKAAKKAAGQQAEGTSDAIAENQRQFDILQENQKPYLVAGKTALGTLAAENDIPLDTSKIQLEPGYQFGLKQGQQAIDRQTAASGGRISGAALKAAAQYGIDYATNGYSTAYARANQARTDRLNRLAALSGVGQTATQNIGSLGADLAGRNSALMVSAGNNAGAATLAKGNIWGNVGNQLTALYGRYGSAGSQVPGYNNASMGYGDTSRYDSYAPTAAADGGWGIE